VTDPNGAVIVRAEVTVTSNASGDTRKALTDNDGNYSVRLLPPGIYNLKVTSYGFKAVFSSIQIFITQTATFNAELLDLAEVNFDPVTVQTAPLVQADGPQLGHVVDSRAVSELPLATRNFTQLLGLSPGTAVALPDNTELGRNSQNVSVNGARRTQNNYQLNGVEAMRVGPNAAA
jgi:hypothetical protein